MGESGLISQLLGPKYGAFMVFGSLGDKNVPGLPSLASIKQVYKLEYMNVDTKIFGVVSSPVSHSKGPLLHNPAFRHTEYNGIYVPLLVDDLQEFFSVYSSSDFAGFRYIFLCCNASLCSIRCGTEHLFFQSVVLEYPTKKRL